MKIDFDRILERLEKSAFRSKFNLSKQDKEYVKNKGEEIIFSHTKDFIESRLSSKNPINDGKQTPMRGHPTFVAQHATATCCRECLFKWYKIQKNKILTEDEKEFIAKIIMAWINKQMVI